MRRYPLHQNGREDQEKGKEQADKAAEDIKWKTPRPIKKIILPVINWGEEKVLVLRRVKMKLTIYVIACTPQRLKPSTALIKAY